MEVDDFDEELVNNIHPLEFSARANAEDTPRYDEAMHSPDAAGFNATMDEATNGQRRLECCLF